MSTHSVGAGVGAPTSSARILIASDDEGSRASLVRQLGELGYSVIGDVANGRDMVDRARDLAPDIVILDLQHANGSAFDAAERLAQDVPNTATILLTADAAIGLTEQQFARTTAFGVLPRAVHPRSIDSAVRLAVHRARELRAARDEATSLRTQLENRKAIERAKGILMRRTGLSEQEAYRILQRTSQDRSVPMAVVAKEVLESEPGR